MKIVEDWGSTYGGAINHYWHFEDYSEDDGKNVFFLGLSTSTARYKEQYKNYENKIFFNTEHPCAFYDTNRDVIRRSSNLDSYYSKIFTQDPYTADWLNDLQKKNTFVHIFTTPINERYIVQEKQEKEYDALYWGGIHSQVHVGILNAIKDFKYNFLSLGPRHWGLQDLACAELMTHQNAPRSEMWELIRKTKINVMTNLLFINTEHAKRIKKIKNWDKNEAFSHIDELMLPQIKTRPFESAINRCLMLVKRDPWNIIEYWFEPDKEFIYYDNEEDLPEIINGILSNWEDYESIIENAFKKAINNYTTDHFMEIVKRECI